MTRPSQFDPVTRCECCSKPASRTCARLDLPALHFCAEHFTEHQCGAHPEEQQLVTALTYLPRMLELFHVVCRACNSDQFTGIAVNGQVMFRCAQCDAMEIL
jgi:hypothetical protein